MTFQNEILNWYQQNKRMLPWRDTTDAYVIWLSEIILQQTRVEQGLPYFYRFLEAYPTVSDFANASETQILKLWQGLGYYSRGRNMLFTARQVMEAHHGVFPTSYDSLIRLKGIGDYTAAAISSFSANESRPVLDGNVFRLLSRYFGIETPINSSKGKKQFMELAQALIAGQLQPSDYNQAIMEFGALQCKPKPLCHSCPLRSDCYAIKNDLTTTLPVKEKKLKKRNRHFNYFVCIKDDEILINKRNAGDIWQELYDFPLIETTTSYADQHNEFLNMVRMVFGPDCTIKPLIHKKHLLTHQTIYVQFFALDNYIINFNQNAEIKWVTLALFDELPQPKVIADFMDAIPVN
ncbi:A/G-specific adenine glycosylase [Pedobacter psychroterrae]|uniref:Adenine DNA glycosylase n=1 Tax=Pedobacter psychroterrae TaxID=2530453 RepID=A0A4R0NT15_9SPHI|nr:A/G-specific adenine glycosylase [Pedobacter psychroterrae]TCD03289.1 A/G-specific adenine glycosylase [Pedobacter psychroterrae]